MIGIDIPAFVDETETGLRRRIGKRKEKECIDTADRLLNQ